MLQRFLDRRLIQRLVTFDLKQLFSTTEPLHVAKGSFLFHLIVKLMLEVSLGWFKGFNGFSQLDFGQSLSSVKKKL